MHASFLENKKWPLYSRPRPREWVRAIAFNLLHKVINNMPEVIHLNISHNIHSVWGRSCE